MNLESIVYYAFALLVAITVHEAAHAWMAYKLGDHTAKYAGRVTLNPLAHLDPIGTIMIFIANFGWGKPVPYNPYHLKDPKKGAALIALAGPMANFITALLLSIVLQHFPFFTLFGSSLGAFTQNIVYFTIYLNIALMCFNILPIAPLDGSKLIGAFIPNQHYEQYQEYLRMGPFILIGLIILQNFGINILGRIIMPLIDGVYTLTQLIT